MIENLSDKKKKESENTLNKLYNTEYKLDLPYEVKNVEKLSKTIKKNKKGEYIIENTLTFKDIFSKSTDELFEIIKKLSELYEENEEYEYFGYYTKDYVLLRDKFEPIKDFSGLPYSERGRLSNRPLENVWRNFYKKEIKDFPTLLQLYLLLMIGMEGSNNRELTEVQENIYMKMLGFDVMELLNKLKEANLKYVFSTIPYDPTTYHPAGRVIDIISLLYRDYSEENKKYLFEFGKAVGLYVLENIDPKYMVEETKNYRNETYYEIVLNAVAFVYTNMYYIIIKALENLEEFYDEKSFIEAFVIRYHLDEKLNEYILELDNKSKDEKRVAFSSLDNYMSNYRNTLAKKEDKSLAKFNPFMLNEALKIIYDEGRKIVDYLVQNELKRGDSPTKYSELLHGIKRIEGIDYLVQILQALGKETLDRAAYYWEEMILKNLCLVIY